MQNSNRELLIQRGLELLTERGLAATGLAPLLKDVGIPKGSFYYYFESKDEFGYALLERYADFMNYKLDKYLLDNDYSVLDRIHHFIDSAARGMSKYEFKRGCLVGNLNQEVTLLPTKFKPKIESIFATWEQKISNCLRIGKETGEITTAVNCDDLAQFFWIGWEGAVQRSRLTLSREPLDIFFIFFKTVVQE